VALAKPTPEPPPRTPQPHPEQLYGARIPGHGPLPKCPVLRSLKRRVALEQLSCEVARTRQEIAILGQPGVPHLDSS
jgi:hypothetical protein